MYLLAISIFLILFVHLSYRKAIFGTYAVIFSLPLYFLKFSIVGMPVTVLEAMIYLLALVFSVKYLKESRKLDIRGIWRKEPLFAAGVVLLFCGVVISTVFSSDTRVSAGILKAWFFDPFLFFLVFASIVKKEKELLRSLFALALSGFTVALAAFVYWIMPEYRGVTYDGRLRAFYLSANHLAMYLAPAIIIIFGFMICYVKDFLGSSLREVLRADDEVMPAADPPKADNLSLLVRLLAEMRDFSCLALKPRKLSDLTFKIISVIIFLLIGIPFYLTYSYSAWFGVLAAFVFILILFYKGNSTRLVCIIIFLIFLAGIIFSRANADKFKNIMNFSYPSISSRTVIWRVAADILKEHPFIGIGPGTFQDYYLKKQADYPPYPEWAVPQPHNIFLAFWLEAGILGLIGFILILIWFFKSGIKIMKDCRSDKPRPVTTSNVTGVTIICLAIMIYSLVHGLFDTTYWKNDLAMIFWLMISIMYLIKKVSS